MVLNPWYTFLMIHKRFSPEEFKSIYSKVPRLTVDLTIKNTDGILLSLRTLPSWHNQWHLPGGTVFLGERVEEAVARVAKDELGIDITIEKFLGYNEFLSEKKERGFGFSVSLNFLCATEATEFVHDEDASEVKTFTELPENTITEQKEFLQKHWNELGI